MKKRRLQRVDEKLIEIYKYFKKKYELDISFAEFTELLSDLLTYKKIKKRKGRKFLEFSLEDLSLFSPS